MTSQNTDLYNVDSKTGTTTSTKVVLAREPVLFWRENAIAVIILLRSRSGGNRLSNVKSFIILRSRESF